MSFIFILIILPYIFTYIILPFYTFSKNENEQSFDSLLNNIFYTYLTIGNPPQTIVGIIMPNEYSLNIYNHLCEIKSNFIVEKSTTYKSKEFEVQYITNITLSYLITDKFEFIFNETNSKQYIDSITYHYRPYNNSDISKNKQYPYTCAHIGFKIPKYNSEESSQSLILQLKKLRVINNHCFFILYDNNNDDEGKLIIGEYPDKYDSNKYKNYQLKTIYSLDLDNNYNWHLKFNSIYFNINEQKISFKNYDSIIDFSSGVIFSPEEYFNQIYKYIFKEKIDKGICTQNKNDENTQYFICTSIDDMQNFPTVYIRHSFLLYTFELNYKDLFKKKNDKYYFIICYNKEFINVWKFGKPFLKKYLFLFNYDEKIIGFYNPLINVDGSLMNDNQINNKNNNYSEIVIYSFILILFAFLLLFFISRRFYKKRNNNKIWSNNNKSKIQELIYTNLNKD